MTMEQRTLLLVLTIGALAPFVVELVPRIKLPAMVLEIGLGIVVGPQVLDWARPGPNLDVLARFGMVALFFLAGLEIDFNAIRGRPLALASAGWLLSAGLALGLSWVLTKTGLTLDRMVVAVALTTTALGALIPILRDAGVLNSKFGSFAVAMGAAGEFGPIVLISVLLTAGEATSHVVATVTLLALFGSLAGIAFVASRKRPDYLGDLFWRKLHTSAQLPVRISVLLLAGLVLLTRRFGLDSVLGALAAGTIVRVSWWGHTGEMVRHKLEGIGYGFFVPIFFVASGLKFDLNALTSSAQALWRLPLFLLLFLVVRGVPVLLCQRDLPRGDLLPLALLAATELPLVVAVTEIAVETGKMRPVNASALVGAGMVSVLVYPLMALSLRKEHDAGMNACSDKQSGSGVSDLPTGQ
jgi:Kef-type K+ transport system membrane component KefB